MRRKSSKSTPGQRHQLRWKLDTEGGRKWVPSKLRNGKKQEAGRNNRGRITVRHRGGGKKRRLRRRYPMTTKGVRRNRGWGKVRGIQYDPNRTARIALVEWMEAGQAEYTYVLAAEGLKVGKRIQIGKRGEEDGTSRLASLAKEGSTGRETRRSNRSERGSRKPLKDIPIGSTVCNLELEPGKGGKYRRSAGTGGVLLRKPEGKALVRLPSGQRIEVPLECRATIGRVGGEEHQMESIGKAGRNRNRGWRPTVRGEAMNPVDHPHGGRTRGGRPEVTPWGRLAKGTKTRKPKAKSKWMVVRS